MLRPIRFALRNAATVFWPTPLLPRRPVGGVEPLQERLEKWQPRVVGRDLLECRHVGARGFEVVLLKRDFGVRHEFDDFRREVRAPRGRHVGREGDGLVLGVEDLE